jgi:AcrR family transcriptional regulator
LPSKSRRVGNGGRGRPTGVEQAEVRLRTREAILDTALSLYGHSGYSGVTIRALGKEMGLKAPSLYHYFDSKEEMFVCLQQRALTLQEAFMIRDLTDDPVADVDLFFNRYIEFAQAHPEYFTLLYIDPAVPAHCRERAWTDGHKWVRQAGLQLIRRCVEAGRFPRETDGLLVLILLWHAALGAAVILRSAPALVPDRGDTSAIRLLLDGIGAGLLSESVHQSAEAPAMLTSESR